MQLGQPKAQYLLRDIDARHMLLRGDFPLTIQVLDDKGGCYRRLGLRHDQYIKNRNRLEVWQEDFLKYRKSKALFLSIRRNCIDIQRFSDYSDSTSRYFLLLKLQNIS